MSRNRFKSSIIDYTKGTRCTDPRDRVFVLLSLLHGFKSSLNIDSYYSGPTLEIYRDVVMRFVDPVGFLGILEGIKLDEELLQGPSRCRIGHVHDRQLLLTIK